MLFVKWQEKKEDLKLLQEEFDMEREDLVDTIRALDKQMKLKQLVIDTFLPPEVFSQLDGLKHWDNFNDQWSLPGLQFAGNNVPRLEPQSLPFRFMPAGPSGFNVGGNAGGFMHGLAGGGLGGHPGAQYDGSTYPQQDLAPEVLARLQRRMNQPGEPPLAEEMYYNYGIEGQQTGKYRKNKMKWRA
jgi:hypothetical protein